MEKLKKQKAKLLDDVMETETYKVAKELLDDFATDAEKRQLNVRLFLDASMLSRFKELIDLVLRNRFLDSVSRKSSGRLGQVGSFLTKLRPSYLPTWHLHEIS